MNRRAFVSLLGAAAWPIAARGQQVLPVVALSAMAAPMPPLHNWQLRLATTASAIFISSASASRGADIVKGEAAFVRQCAICHTIDKGGENRVGPNLFGVIGRRAGSAPGFKYTNAFRTIATFEWTEGLLGSWIALPSVMIPGTAMGVFPGVSDRNKDDIVAYLAAQK